MDELSRTLYDDIRGVAAAQLRGDRALRSICATDLAHEAMERALRQHAADGVPRAEILRRVSRLCRQVLVDRARARGRLRRGGGAAAVQLDFDPSDPALDGPAPAGDAGAMEALDLLVLDEALEQLKELNEKHAAIVELRFFGGLNMPEIASVLGGSLSAIEKEWRKARAWLALKMREGDGRS